MHISAAASAISLTVFDWDKYHLRGISIRTGIMA
jgi:hypothetical protein